MAQNRPPMDGDPDLVSSQKILGQEHLANEQE